MYLCIQYGALGSLSGSEVANVSDCAAGRYIAAPVEQFSDLPTLTDIFTIPLTDDLQTMWMTGFALPVICYLTAWGYQVLISWFNSRHHEEQ